jgi:hypothetical protein
MAPGESLLNRFRAEIDRVPMLSWIHIQRGGIHELCPASAPMRHMWTARAPTCAWIIKETPAFNRSARLRKKRSRCCSPISSAFSTTTDCDCVAPAARETSSCSQPLLRTCETGQPSQPAAPRRRIASDCVGRRERNALKPHKRPKIVPQPPPDSQLPAAQRHTCCETSMMQFGKQ